MTWMTAPEQVVYQNLKDHDDKALQHRRESPSVLLWAAEPDLGHAAKVPLLRSYIFWQTLGSDWACLAAGLLKLSLGHWCLELLHEQPCEFFWVAADCLAHKSRRKFLALVFVAHSPPTCSAQWVLSQSYFYISLILLQSETMFDKLHRAEVNPVACH